MTRLCVAVFGGTFDPVHNGHVALAARFIEVLQPDVLRLLPAGNPWQKQGLQTPAAHRVAMVERAFGPLRARVPLEIDQQEIERHTPTYTVETLRALRAELGPEASLVFLMGADQLQGLHTWQEWPALFELAHLGVAARPGYLQQAHAMTADVAQAFRQRLGTPEQLRNSAHGLCYFDESLALDISATAIRDALEKGASPQALLPAAVLDYIQHHHLYRH